MEYYGFEASGPVQPTDRHLGPAIYVKMSMSQPQGLRTGGRTIDLHAMGNRGDQIEIRVEDVSLASFLLSERFHHQETDSSIKIP
jgi:hypothetical protein